MWVYHDFLCYPDPDQKEITFCFKNMNYKLKNNKKNHSIVLYFLIEKSRQFFGSDPNETDPTLEVKEAPIFFAVHVRPLMPLTLPELSTNLELPALTIRRKIFLTPKKFQLQYIHM